MKGTGTSYTFVTKPAAVKKGKKLFPRRKKDSFHQLEKRQKARPDMLSTWQPRKRENIRRKSHRRKKTSYTKTKLKKGKTYYFKVRAYKTYKGKKTYSAYSKVVKVKIK